LPRIIQFFAFDFVEKHDKQRLDSSFRWNDEPGAMNRAPTLPAGGSGVEPPIGAKRREREFL
jgi:hypothetical protein